MFFILYIYTEKEKLTMLKTSANKNFFRATASFVGGFAHIQRW